MPENARVEARRLSASRSARPPPRVT
jgi:hypothetical protein